MPCPSCGAESAGPSRYCPSCGNPLAESPWDRERASAASHAEVAGGIRLLCAEFEGRKPLYDRMERLSAAVERCEQKLSSYKPLIFTVAWVAFWSFGAYASYQNGTTQATPIPLQVLFLLIVCLPGFLPVFLRAYRHFLVRRCRERMGAAYDEAMAHYRKVPGNPFAFEYSDPYTLEALYQIVRTGKADTAKEAVNALERSRYQSSMLNLQGRILEEARGAKEAAQVAALFSVVAAVRR